MSSGYVVLSQPPMSALPRALIYFVGSRAAAESVEDYDVEAGAGGNGRRGSGGGCGAEMTRLRREPMPTRRRCCRRTQTMGAQ
jgi:hypothetical protein